MSEKSHSPDSDTSATQLRRTQKPRGRLPWQGRRPAVFPAGRGLSAPTAPRSTKSYPSTLFARGRALRPRDRLATSSPVRVLCPQHRKSSTPTRSGMRPDPDFKHSNPNYWLLTPGPQAPGRMAESVCRPALGHRCQQLGYDQPASLALRRPSESKPNPGTSHLISLRHPPAPRQPPRCGSL